MLTQAIAILAACTNPIQEAPTAKYLIEKMLGRYHSAKTVTGKIRLTVNAEGNSASLDTTLQYERPAKLYVFQKKDVANPDPEQPSKWLITSDGISFSYNIPNDDYQPGVAVRLTEPVDNIRVRVTHDIGSIYAASSKSIGDRSMPLDIAIAARTDLMYRRNQWVDFAAAGEKEIRGKHAYIVSGGYRQVAGGPATGTYQMAITKDGDLLQYVEKARFGVGDGAASRPVWITSQWDVELVVNGPVNQGLFKVIP
jgi:hypothetical protein